MTTKRYFYQCPIKAAYMAKEFGMKFVNRYKEPVSKEDLYFTIPGHEDGVWDKICKLEYGAHEIFISTDSLHLLEPQEGDIGWDALNDLCEMWESGWRKVCDIRGERGYKPIMPIEIILRNGKAFMWPDVEDIVA